MTELEKRDLYIVVSRIESNHDPTAFRFEPEFADRIPNNDPALKRASEYYHAYTPSLKAFLSFSVGRIQVLVYNLFFYPEVFEVVKSLRKFPSVPYILSEAEEFEIFKALLKAFRIDFNPLESYQNAVAFATRYNGNPAYANRLYRGYIDEFGDKPFEIA